MALRIVTVTLAPRAQFLFLTIGPAIMKKHKMKKKKNCAKLKAYVSLKLYRSIKIAVKYVNYGNLFQRLV